MHLLRRPVPNSSRRKAVNFDLIQELGLNIKCAEIQRLTTFKVSVIYSPQLTYPADGSNGSCANVDCQKGTCVPNNSSIITDLIFPYKCVCDSGWSTLESLIPLLAIPSLPCNIPNCTLNLNCSGSAPAPAPAPSSVTPAANSSACLVPGICGHGKCEIVQNSTLAVSSFKCVCNPGYANILNMTAGYCANQCEIGGNCQNLGITLGGQSPSPSPAGGASVNSTSISPNAAWCRTSHSHGFYTSAGLMILGSFFLAQR